MPDKLQSRRKTFSIFQMERPYYTLNLIHFENNMIEQIL